VCVWEEQQQQEQQHIESSKQGEGRGRRQGLEPVIAMIVGV
jgi:hypothetical protein